MGHEANVLLSCHSSWATKKMNVPGISNRELHSLTRLRWTHRCNSSFWGMTMDVDILHGNTIAASFWHCSYFRCLKVATTGNLFDTPSPGNLPTLEPDMRQGDKKTSCHWEPLSRSGQNSQPGCPLSAWPGVRFCWGGRTVFGGLLCNLCENMELVSWWAVFHPGKCK